MLSWKETEDRVTHSCWFTTYNYCHNHNCHSTPHSLIGVQCAHHIVRELFCFVFCFVKFICSFPGSHLMSHYPSLSCHPEKKWAGKKMVYGWMDLSIARRMHDWTYSSLSVLSHLKHKYLSFFYFLPFFLFSLLSFFLPFFLTFCLSVSFSFNTFKINTNLT